MDWTAPIDAYCERLGPGLLAEPLNAASNLAFLVAAVIGWRASENGRVSRLGATFALLTGIIGIGSLLFHTFADRWSSFADVLPIAIFIHGYFAVALWRFVGLSLPWAIAGTVLFALGSVFLVPALEPALGSSAGYAPALLALFGMGGGLVSQAHPTGRWLLGTGLVFTASLSLRMADEPLCAPLPFGTHFGWHILNSATLGMLVMALVRDDRRRSGRGTIA